MPGALAESRIAVRLRISPHLRIRAIIEGGQPVQGMRRRAVLRKGQIALILIEVVTACDPVDGLAVRRSQADFLTPLLVVHGLTGIRNGGSAVAIRIVG